MITLLFFFGIAHAQSFVTIPAGDFQQGSPSNEFARYPDEGPVHAAVIDRPFELARQEVTQAEWYSVMKTNPSYFKSKKFCPDSYQRIDGTDLCPSFPVENVSWFDVQDYLSALNAADPLHHYRLPSEAEWEYSARAGTATAFYFGDSPDELSNFAWHDGNSDGQTHSVGSKQPNAFGLYDMHGNVSEWVEDEFAYYPGSELPVPSTPYRSTYRGGSFFGLPINLRSAARFGKRPADYNETIGFRVAREGI